MKYILSSKVCFPTAQLLRDYLTPKFNERILVTANPDKIKRNNLLFAYGKCINNNPLNSAGFIDLCSNKLRFSQLLLNHNLYTPEYHYQSIPNAEDFPVLIRKTLTSYGGKGIIPCSDLNTFMTNRGNRYYWTKFIKTQFELRVHVFDNQIIKVFKKESENEESELPIRNLENGYHFALKDINNYPKVFDLIQNKLSNILVGAVHYGLDLGYDINKHEYLIYEANSGCGLNDMTASLYADLIYNKLTT